MSEELSESRLGYLVNQTARRFRIYREERLRELGIGGGAIPVLMSLRDQAVMSQKALAEFAGVEQPSMAQLLGRMSRDGLIQRSPDPKDLRSALIRLTPKAEALLPEVEAILEASNAQAVVGLSEEEQAQLHELLRRVAANFD